MKTPTLVCALGTLLAGCAPHNKTEFILEAPQRETQFGGIIFAADYISHLKSDIISAQNRVSVSATLESQANGRARYKVTLASRGNIDDGERIKTIFSGYLAEERSRVTEDLSIRLAYVKEESIQNELKARIAEWSVVPRILEIK